MNLFMIKNFIYDKNYIYPFIINNYYYYYYFVFHRMNVCHLSTKQRNRRHFYWICSESTRSIRMPVSRAVPLGTRARLFWKQSRLCYWRISSEGQPIKSHAWDGKRRWPIHLLSDQSRWGYKDGAWPRRWIRGMESELCNYFYNLIKISTYYFFFYEYTLYTFK